MKYKFKHAHVFKPVHFGNFIEIFNWIEATFQTAFQLVRLWFPTMVILLSPLCLCSMEAALTKISSFASKYLLCVLPDAIHFESLTRHELQIELTHLKRKYSHVIRNRHQLGKQIIERV